MRIMFISILFLKKGKGLVGNIKNWRDNLLFFECMKSFIV